MIEIERHILLKTKKELDKETVRKWFKCVRNNAPSGTVLTVQSQDENNKPTNISLISREIKECFYYIIPLSRDLNDKEVENIVDKFSLQTDIDFEIETSEAHFSVAEEKPIVLNSDRYLDLCSKIAKRKHEDWVRERTDSGWSYGTVFSNSNKTHPLLVSWDRLPDKFKVPDLDLPQMIIDTLENSGYTVVSKDDLDKMSHLLRIKQ